jgi:hypothetical protein
MNQLNMEYNSQRELLIIPEYGRNVQNLISQAKEIEDKEKRQAFVEAIVDLIMQMHPQNKNLEDYRDKIWKHVFRIANYELSDVLPPNGKTPTPEDSEKRPEHVGYPDIDSKFRHYGHNIQKLIAKAISMEDGPIKDAFVQVIGSYMKLAYKTWNREHYVSDEIIIGDLESLSEGKLKVKSDASLDNLTLPSKKRKRNTSGKSGGKSNGHQSHKGGRHKRNKRK